MINTNELRRGNLIKHVPIADSAKIIKPAMLGHFEVEEIRPASISVTELSTTLPFAFTMADAEGIPLTPELLERCGFLPREHLGDYFRHVSKYGDILILKDARVKICASNSTAAIFREIFFLHELQNLFYSLTREELVIKDK